MAAWQAKLLSEAATASFRPSDRLSKAAVRWGYISQNPAKPAGRSRQPAPWAVRVFTRDELDAIAAELSPMHARPANELADRFT